jgi:hypothetical protein
VVCAPCAAGPAGNLEKGIQGIETFGLGSDVGIGDGALPDVGVCDKVLDKGIMRLGRLELCGCCFIGLLAHLPVFVYEAIGQGQFAEIFLLFGHAGRACRWVCVGVCCWQCEVWMRCDVMRCDRRVCVGRVRSWIPKVSR